MKFTDRVRAVFGFPTEAERVCWQTYQVVGSLLSDVEAFGTEIGDKALDNLCAARLVHADVLPWPSFEKREPAQTEPA